MKTKKKTSARRSRSTKTTTPPRPAASRPPSPRRGRPGTIELPRLLTVDEVADLLRTSRGSIYAKIRQGTLPGVIRISRRLLIDGAAVLSWLDERRAVSLNDQGDQR